MYRCAWATAWWADRPGRKPELCSENVGSHRSWRTCSRACWISLSTTHGTPSFLTPPSGLGISTLFTAAARRFPRAVPTGCLASAHADRPWRPRWSSHRRQGYLCYCELVSTLLRDLLDR